MRGLFFFIFIIFICHVSTVWAANWYVDKDASGSNNGASWTNAWVSFSAINWSSVKPGDTIYISGGTTSKIYYEQLDIDANGSIGSPLTVRVGQDNGHNGTVIITAPPDQDGIKIQNNQYITINGGYKNQQKIKIYNSGLSGVSLSGDTYHIILTYLDIDHNGYTGSAQGWKRNGILFNVSDYSGKILEISYCKIHHNYADQIFGSNPGGIGHEYSRIVVHHNEIYEMPDDGFETGVAGIDFYENLMHGPLVVGAGGHPDGVAFMNSYVRVWNNRFYNFATPGFYSNAMLYINPYSSSPRSVENIEVYNNLIYEEGTADPDNYQRGITFSAQGSINDISNVVIANNTIVSMPGTGMELYFNGLDSNHVNDVLVVNNIMHNCYTLYGGQALAIGAWNCTIGSHGDGEDVTFDYNCINGGANGASAVYYKGSWMSYNYWILISHANDNGIIVDPSLDSYYRPDSELDPVVNIGIDLSYIFTFDIENMLRPQGIKWDIGAFEFPQNGYASVPLPPERLRIK